jgi:hypothetical protein
VRVLAGLIHKVGLVSPQQVNLAGSGLTAYKQFSSENPIRRIDPALRRPTEDDEDEPSPVSTDDHSMTWAWRILEYVPKNDKYKEWPPRHSYLGLYIPNAEPRLIPEGAFIHESALRRMESVAGYRPINLPARYQTYEMASSLLVVGDEYVDPIVGADHSSPHQLMVT